MSEKFVRDFRSEQALFVNQIGVGLASPAMNEGAAENARPVFCVGLNGFVTSAWGEPVNMPTVMSWRQLAQLVGAAQAALDRLDPDRQVAADDIRADARRCGNEYLDEIAQQFRDGQGAPS